MFTQAVSDAIRTEGTLEDTYQAVYEQVRHVHTRNMDIQALLKQRKLLPNGLTPNQVKSILYELSELDSNNAKGHAGLGEREGRYLSPVVEERTYGMAHGIGRGGDLTAAQPKAIESLTPIQAGYTSVKETTVLPVATGMSIMLSLLSLRALNPGADSVIWCRCDQKSCPKAVQMAGLTLVPVDGILETNQSREAERVVTDLTGVARAIEKVTLPRVLCVICTTSCFSPREPDRVPEIAGICSITGVPFLVNNAYGVQSKTAARLISQGTQKIPRLTDDVHCVLQRLKPDAYITNGSSQRPSLPLDLKGRVDLVIQSLDKNFGVPVGGALLTAPVGGALLTAPARTLPSHPLLPSTLSRQERGVIMRERAQSDKAKREQPSLLARVVSSYPGRASGAEVMDLFCTLLGLGESGWKEVLEQRIDVRAYLTAEVTVLCNRHSDHLTLLPIKHNDISCAVVFKEMGEDQCKQVGSRMFVRGVTGSRVWVTQTEDKLIGPVSFRAWGSHHSEWTAPYITFATAVGMTRSEVDKGLSVFEECLLSVLKQPV
ncbi:O-phosphoseryl-tRNA(Sec) selenium transferase [Kipferlia bialata]|uniref:O-phosphoseryl-tRNA(Sec) selenium transferase n=1 Tax=Kipferlia bialata TaxID=797122 RepID=A0A9K3CUL4_9EUKA|nr:O-phosphoseryl-tRNA(Sec) selenium transferase [Kipferlia bialata]|eukprot:g3778.t1